MDKKYELLNVEIYQKGDLKGYLQAMIEFENGYTHELLYRFDDIENGNNYELVSIDYGYNNPMVAELWDEIEKECFSLVNKSNNAVG